MNILLIGPQGSGKGTQADKLIKRFNLAHVEMGGLMRKISKEDTELGHKVAGFINSGKLVPDETTIEILNDHLDGIGRLDGVLFDGFPRVVSQAQYFEKYLAKKGQKLDIVFLLTLPRKDVFERLANRRTCGECGQVFNVKTKPPKTEGHCDSCSGNLIVRPDETPEKINTRLDAYEKQTLPMVDLFREKGLVEEINGVDSIDNIFDEILSRLEKRGLLNNG